MKKYIVIFEARQNGAIGIFSPECVEVIAENEQGAADKAREKLNEQGLETRFPVSIRLN